MKNLYNALSIIQIILSGFLTSFCWFGAGEKSHAIFAALLCGYFIGEAIHKWKK